MNWINIILLIIRFLPDIINLVKEIIGLIDGLTDKRQARLEMRKLRAGIQEAREGRFGILERQLCRLRDECGKK